ncbi:hypothetical protein GCM10022224_080860 [Nonomuraea antimicrobica]|uniref:Uncharacterized protein n=1 Tax=Nonomuraea antimicrobica TaxID=561173 RepID=A0ABP7DDJ1_9ACTN
MPNRILRGGFAPVQNGSNAVELRVEGVVGSFLRPERGARTGVPPRSGTPVRRGMETWVRRTSPSARSAGAG